MCNSNVIFEKCVTELCSMAVNDALLLLCLINQMFCDVIKATLYEELYIRPQCEKAKSIAVIAHKKFVKSFQKFLTYLNGCDYFCNVVIN